MTMQRDLDVATRFPEPEISWSAVIAGAAVALATSLFLTVLAAGFGLTVTVGGLASRGSLAGFSPMFGAAAIVAQVLAAGFGGYIAGRLRHPWFSAHLDEAHFRDTAHGLLSWALSTVIGVVIAASVLIPYAAQLAGPTVVAPALTADEALRASNIAMQAAFFTAVGMLLSAFVAAVAARVGGLRNEEMQAKGRP